MRQPASLLVALGLLLVVGPAPAQDAPPAPAPADPPAAPAEGEPTPPADEAAAAAPLATPEACFEAAKAAFNKRDWRGFVRCVSPQRRDTLIGQMAATFAMMAQAQDADPRVVALVQKYLPPGFDPMQVLMDEDNDEAMQQVVRRIPNRLTFFAEAMSLAFSMEYPNPDEGATITELTDLTTGQEAVTAKGTVHLQVGEETTQDDWAFEKIEDGWYLTME